MKFLSFLSSTLATALALAPTHSLACGEGQFNMGQGLKYQVYLAPRPATVLVYADDAGESSPARRQALISGLRASGHKVTEVHDDAALAQAIQGQHFDVLIASYENIDKVSTAGRADGATPTLLPVVARNQRNSPELKQRFGNFLLDGASLGQYLKSINNALLASAR